jgi:hypothetical protein
MTAAKNNVETPFLEIDAKESYHDGFGKKPIVSLL